jgi:hypothetical protein
MRLVALVLVLFLLLVISVALIIAKAGGTSPDLRWYGGSNAIIVPVLLFFALLACLPIFMLRDLEPCVAIAFCMCLTPVAIVAGLVMAKVRLFSNSVPSSDCISHHASFVALHQLQGWDVGLQFVLIPFFFANGLTLLIIWVVSLFTCTSGWCDFPRCLSCTRSDARRACVFGPLLTVLIGLVVLFEIFLALHDARVLVPDSQGGNWGWRYTFIPLAILLGALSVGCCLIFAFHYNHYPGPPTAPVDHESAVRDMTMPRQQHQAYRDIDDYDDDLYL